MNVTFHTLASLTTVAILSPKIKPSIALIPGSVRDLIFPIVGFLTGILIHGILDYTPHNYPIPSIIDVLLSLSLLAAALIAVKPHLRLLTVLCFVGGIFPDLVDLATAIINKRLGTALPVVKIFPWHWAVYSGSIYDGSRRIESAIYHSIVVFTGIYILYLSRNRWLNRKQSR